MSFIDKYPTQKTDQEEKMENKIKLVSLISTALRKTSQERTEGLILTDEQIEIIVSKVREFNFDNNKKSVGTLEGVVLRVLRDSNDPEIKSILLKQSKIYEAKQAELINSEEYDEATFISSKYDNAVIEAKNGKIDIEMLEIDSSERTLSDR